MAIAFLLVNTKWCWYLSDDDEIIDNSLEKVLYDIDRNSDVSAIKYSIDTVEPHLDIRINSIAEFVNYYKIHNKGEMIFLSMVYNMDILRPWLGMMTMYSYTYIPFLIPVIKSLSEGFSCQLSSFVAYKYESNQDSWSANPESFLKVMLGFRTFLDIPLNLNVRDRENLDRLICYHCNPSQLIKCLFAMNDSLKRRRYYNLLKNYCLLTAKDRIKFGLSFFLYDKLGIDVRLLKKKKRQNR